MICISCDNLCFSLADFANLGTCIGAFFAFATLWSAKKQHKEQMEQQLEERYSNRYTHIMELMPGCFFSSKKNIKISDKDIEKMHCCIRLYIDLCSEQLTIHEDGRITNKMWKEWKEGMEGMFKNEHILAFLQENDIENCYPDLMHFLRKECKLTIPSYNA